MWEHCSERLGDDYRKLDAKTQPSLPSSVLRLSSVLAARSES